MAGIKKIPNRRPTAPDDDLQPEPALRQPQRLPHAAPDGAADAPPWRLL